MTDTTTVDTTTTTTAPPPWYDGVDAETTGFWKNKGLDLADPKKFATGLTTMYKEAEKYVGVPPNLLVRLPADPIKDADMMTQVWNRLGKPDAADKYDFPALKDKDGKVTDAALDAALRNGLFKANAPAGMASEVAAAVAKHLADQETERVAANTAALKQEQETLAKNWGANAPVNKSVAQSAARALGMTPEEVNALEKTIGYARTMETLRNIGSKIGEDKFVNSDSGKNQGVMSKDQAIAKAAELKSDETWRTRYLAGGKAEFRQMQDLLNIISEGREIRL